MYTKIIHSLRSISKAGLKLILILIMSIMALYAQQNSYDRAWSKVNEGKLDSAIHYFKESVKDPIYKENSLLSLTMLYTQERKTEEASDFFAKYLEISENPYPALFALWFNEGVVGMNLKKEDHQLKLLNQLSEPKNPLTRAVLYRLYIHYVFSNNFKEAEVYSEQLKTLKNWSVVGPFDNIVNSGFNKDFGALSKPGPDAVFTTKYGAETKWLINPAELKDGYYFKGTNFEGDNSIIYAQSYVKSDSEQTTIVSLGYSGSLKVWVNDELIYAESNRRRTELDFYQVKVKLNKGYNRFLIQLGDYNEPTANFSVRLMDSLGDELELEHTAEYQEYKKKLEYKEDVPHFALGYFKKQIKENSEDLLPKILLAKSHMRALEFKHAEEIYKEILQEHPHNFFALKNLVLLYSESGNSTNQSKYYGILEDSNPLIYDILSNKVDDAYEKGDEKKFNEYANKLLARYSSDYLEQLIGMKRAFLDEDYPKYISNAEDFYRDFPDDYSAMVTYYTIQKDYNKSFYGAKKVLEDYLENNYNYAVLEELANLYVANGFFKKALKLFEEPHKYFPYEKDILKKQVNILFQDKQYREAEEISQKILGQIPLDYTTTSDISNLALFMDDKDKALKYLKKTNEYFPFDFETNEKIRKLQGKEKIMENIGETDPKEIIEEFEAADPQWKKSPYNIILEKKSIIVYSTFAYAKNHNYLLKLNDADALDYWQNLVFNSSTNYGLNINEAYTLKKSGEVIQAERHNDNEVVFVNLEIGDYIFVDYSEIQVNGGKSSRFISDKYSFSSTNPIYKLEYNLYFEDGLKMMDTLTLGKITPEINKLNGFTHYKWKTTLPDIIEDENYIPSSEEIVETLEYSFVPSWDDIVVWYSDLSNHQAEADYTIDKISKELFGEQELTDEEKFRSIYEFVIKNIQYSSIDFRQSNFIPQKASQTYHSRLGDCKDMSTLFVSIARHVGLKANLVLVLTNSNEKSMLLPSLNFNHCIVKIYYGSTEKYLELTSPYLPFGYLQYIHEGAPILEIPHEVQQGKTEAKLEHLSYNEGYFNIIDRNNQIQILDDGRMQIHQEIMNTGVTANYICNTYYNMGEKERLQNLKDEVIDKFKSNISMDSVHFVDLQPRKDSISYSYWFEVSNDVMKIGNLKTLKIPFSDVIIGMNIFDDNMRNYDFDYKEYEKLDHYNESFVFNLDGKQTFKEIPEDVHLSYKGNQYDLVFKRINDKQLHVTRSYAANRRDIKVEEFEDFREFMTKVNKAENTHILFQ